MNVKRQVLNKMAVVRELDFSNLRKIENLDDLEKTLNLPIEGENNECLLIVGNLAA